MESVFYGIETLKINIMTSERIKEIQQETAYPNSVSVHQALLKVWNECEQERVKNCYIPSVVWRSEQFNCLGVNHAKGIKQCSEWCGEDMCQKPSN